MAFDYGDIRSRVRKITGRLSSDELTDEELNDEINKFLHYIFPAEVKLDINLVPYKFLTVKGQEYYPVPESFTNFIPPAWINGYELNYCITENLYYRYFQQYYQKKVFAVGNGALTNFTQGSQNQPILPGSVLITDNVETFSDSGIGPIGVLTGSLGGVGQVNYATGGISVTFNAAPALNTKINITYVNYQSGQPQTLLNFNGNFRVYPIPDSVYEVQMVGYVMPPELVNSNDIPRLEEWGWAIAYGTSRNIFAQNGELDRYAEITALYREQIYYVNRRDIQDTMYRTAQRSI